MKKLLKGDLLYTDRTKKLSARFLIALVLICLLSALAGAVFYRYGYVNKEIVLGQIRDLLKQVKRSGQNQAQPYSGMKMEIIASSITAGQIVAEISYRGITDSVNVLLSPEGEHSLTGNFEGGKLFVKPLNGKRSGVKAFELAAVQKTATLDNWLLMSFAEFNGLKVQNTGFVQLFINGKNFGFYQKIDKLDSGQFPSRTGILARLDDLSSVM